jgi:antitoxin VapB
MSLNILSEEVDRLAERLAAHTGLDKTDAIKQALENELRRLEEVSPLRERVRPIQARIRQRPVTGAAADKTFCDERNDKRR